MLSIIYPVDYAKSRASQNVSSIAFAGTVVGQLLFGWVADNYSRKFAMTASAVILIVFATLCTGSAGNTQGILLMLTICRFFLGAFLSLSLSLSLLLWSFLTLPPQASASAANTPPAPSRPPRPRARSRRARATGGSSSSPT